MVRQASKRVGEESLYFQFQFNTLGPSVSPQIKRTEGLIQVNLGTVPKNVFAIMYFFFIL